MVTVFYKPAGLQYAETHRSAKAQVEASKVYDKIETAVRAKDSVSVNVMRETQVTATRLIFDRMQRLGERFRENHEVSKRDYKLMEKEYKELVKQLHKVIKVKGSDAILSDQTSQLSLGKSVEQITRLSEAVFNGEIKLIDRISELGKKISSAEDLDVIAFEGLYLTQAPGTGRYFGAKEIITAGIEITSGGDEDPVRSVGDLVATVKDSILAQASSAAKAHDITSLANASLLFG